MIPEDCVGCPVMQKRRCTLQGNCTRVRERKNRRARNALLEYSIQKHFRLKKKYGR